MRNPKKSFIVKIFLLFIFTVNSLLPSCVYGQTVLNLPQAGAMVGISPSYVPLAIKGLKVFPEDPFKFDFILDTGNSKFADDKLKTESNLLIKYFLAALTVPDDDQWVNLSPYEKDRIIPDAFGETEMGRDLLAQDYLLKQLSASLIYPEHELGKKFWERVHKRAIEKYGDMDIPVNTFNKVWIMPDHAKVYESGQVAFIVESHLKVMLEEDYQALAKSGEREAESDDQKNALGSQIVREIVLPEIEKEVNEGRNFAKLRQIYHSMIMATWFKRKLRNSILGKVYVGSNKVSGIDVEDKEVKQKIYDQYLAAFKKGVYDYVRDEYDEKTQETSPKKYFAGGFTGGQNVASSTIFETRTPDQLSQAVTVTTVGNLITASSQVDPVVDDAVTRASATVKLDPEVRYLLKDYGFSVQDINKFKKEFMVLFELFDYEMEEVVADVKTLRETLDNDFSRYFPKVVSVIREHMHGSMSSAGEFIQAVAEWYKDGTPERFADIFPGLVESVNKIDDYFPGKALRALVFLNDATRDTRELSAGIDRMVRYGKEFFPEYEERNEYFENHIPWLSETWGEHVSILWPKIIRFLDLLEQDVQRRKLIGKLLSWGIPPIDAIFDNNASYREWADVLEETGEQESELENSYLHPLFRRGLKAVRLAVYSISDFKSAVEMLKKIAIFDPDYSVLLAYNVADLKDLQKFYEIAERLWNGQEQDVRWLGTLLADHSLFDKWSAKGFNDRSVRALGKEIFLSGKVNYINIFQRLFEFEELRKEEHLVLKDFVVNPNVNLSLRMQMVDYYWEVLAVEAMTVNEPADTQNIGELKIAVTQAQERLKSRMQEMSVGGVTKAYQRKIMERTKGDLLDFRKAFLSFILQRPVNERELVLLSEAAISKDIMTVLSIVATLRVVQFTESKLMRDMVRDALQTLFSAYDQGQSDSIESARIKLFEYVLKLERPQVDDKSGQSNIFSNERIIDALEAAGYSRDLWSKGVDIKVKTAKGITEEMKRENIRRATYEMVEIALAAGVATVNGKKISLENAGQLDSYSKARDFVEQLQWRQRNKVPEAGLERLNDILFYVQGQENLKVMAMPAETTFRVTIKKDFLAEASAGVGVPGCFHPAGIHREMPLVHALEANAGFLQVFTESGAQVANVVLLYTPQGVYVDVGHSSSFYDLEEIYAKALAQLTQYVPQLVLRSTSAGYSKLLQYAKPANKSVTLVKPPILFIDQYFDAGETENGSLTLEIKNPLKITKEDVVREDGDFRITKEEAAPQIPVQPTKIDIDLQSLADVLLTKPKNKPYLFLIGMLNKRLAQEGETVINDGFYDWVHQMIMGNRVAAAQTPDQSRSDEIADLLIDFLEVQNWPLRIETPPREIEKKINESDKDAASSQVNPKKDQASAQMRELLALIARFESKTGLTFATMTEFARRYFATHDIEFTEVDKDRFVIEPSTDPTKGLSYLAYLLKSQVGPQYNLIYDDNSPALRRGVYAVADTTNRANVEFGFWALAEFIFSGERVNFEISLRHEMIHAWFDEIFKRGNFSPLTRVETHLDMTKEEVPAQEKIIRVYDDYAVINEGLTTFFNGLQAVSKLDADLGSERNQLYLDFASKRGFDSPYTMPTHLLRSRRIAEVLEYIYSRFGQLLQSLASQPRALSFWEGGMINSPYGYIFSDAKNVEELDPSKHFQILVAKEDIGGLDANDEYNHKEAVYIGFRFPQSKNMPSGETRIYVDDPRILEILAASDSVDQVKLLTALTRSDGPLMKNVADVRAFSKTSLDAIDSIPQLPQALELLTTYPEAKSPKDKATARRALADFWITHLPSIVRQTYQASRQIEDAVRQFEGLEKFSFNMGVAGLEGFDSIVDAGTKASSPLEGNLPGITQSQIPLLHDEIHAVLSEGLPKELAAYEQSSPEQKENVKKLFRNPKTNQLEIPIQGLLRRTGLLTHIGLGQQYGEPVIYYDNLLNNEEMLGRRVLITRGSLLQSGPISEDFIEIDSERELVLAHGRFKIQAWEEKRKALEEQTGKRMDSKQMRQWIQEHSNQQGTGEAQMFERELNGRAPDVSDVFYKTGIISEFQQGRVERSLGRIHQSALQNRSALKKIFQEILGLDVGDLIRPAIFAKAKSPSLAFAHTDDVSGVGEIHILQSLASELTDSELDWLVAHEYGHIQAESYRRQTSVENRPPTTEDFLAEALEGFQFIEDLIDKADFKKIVSDAEKQQIMLLVDPDLKKRLEASAHKEERTADLAGALLGVLSNADPQAIRTGFAKLTEAKFRWGLEPDVKGVHYNSHPSAKERVAYMQEYLTQNELRADVISQIYGERDVAIGTSFTQSASSATSMTDVQKEVLRGTFALARKVGSVEDIRRMDTQEFARRLGAREFTIKINGVGASYETNTLSIEINGQESKFQNLDRKVIESAVYSLMILQQGGSWTPLWAFSKTNWDPIESIPGVVQLLRQNGVDGPGIYFNEELMRIWTKQQNTFFDKTAFVHELFELESARVGLTDPRAVKYLSHHDLFVLEGELRFARIMGGEDFQHALQHIRGQIERLESLAVTAPDTDKAWISGSIIYLNDLLNKMTMNTDTFLNESLEFWQQSVVGSSGVNEDTVGGIDLNEKALDLEVEGEGIEFNDTFDPAQLQNIKIEGFTPVILQIIPTNLPLFIGSAKPEAEMTVSSSQ